MKNKKTIKMSLLGIVVIFLATACSGDFLDIEVPGNLSLDKFYLTDKDAMQATIAMYDMQMEGSSYFCWYLIKTLPSDESNCSGSGSGDQPALQDMDIFNWDSNNDAIKGYWNRTYSVINRANIVIEKVAPENDLRKRLIAEAKALRAYYYLDLVSQWGAVPIILNVLTIDEFQTQTRANKEDVYAQIEKDLKEAIPDLPLKSQYSQADKFRVSKGTAQSILGKAYLYQEKWDEAADILEDIVTSLEYSLEPRFASIFTEKKEFGVESLLEISYTTQKTNFTSGRARKSNNIIQLMGIKAGIYIKAPGDTLVGGGWAFNAPKRILYDAFINAGDEVRRIETLMSVEELRAKGGNWTNPSFWGYEGFIRRKYGSYSTETFDGTSVADWGTNWRLIRYADVLLMLSEAYYRMGGNEENARLMLNKVRERAQLENIDASGEALFEAIVTERRLELALEGHRYPDLIRWGRAADVLGPYGFTPGVHELLPIPDSDVRSGGLEQNPGY
jgi:hypothetical protein